MSAGTPSEDYQYVLIDEDHAAFRDPQAAKREANRRYAAQTPAQRGVWYIAKVTSYVEPDYGLTSKELSLSGKELSKTDGKSPKRTVTEEDTK
jgi:hypothetical protein